MMRPVEATLERGRSGIMFGLGVPEIVIIGVVAVLVFGPKRIPELGSSLGKSLRMFQEGKNAPDEEDENYIDEAED